MQDISKIKPLDVERREHAKQRAVSAIVKSYGEKPQRQDFERDHFERLPPEVTKLVTRIFVAIVVSLFPLSAIRLFVMGSASFDRHPLLVQIVAGLATVCAAEISILGFSLAMSTFATTPRSKRIMSVGVGAAGLFALVANLEYSRPWEHTQAFLWFESTVPVVLFVIGSMAVEWRFLYAVQERHRVSREYGRALSEWKALTADPTSHPKWLQFYANALRDEIYRQSRGTARDALNDFELQDWIDVVQREIDADNWFLKTIAHPEHHESVEHNHAVEAHVTTYPHVYSLPVEDDQGHVGIGAGVSYEDYDVRDNGYRHPKADEGVSNV